MLESLLIVEYMFASYKLLDFSEWLKVVNFLFTKLEKHTCLLTISSHKLASQAMRYLYKTKQRMQGRTSRKLIIWLLLLNICLTCI